MLLDDGVTGDRNSNLKGSAPRAAPAFARDFDIIPNSSSIVVDLKSFTDCKKEIANALRTLFWEVASPSHLS